MLGVADCVLDRVRLAIAQPTEWQRIAATGTVSGTILRSP
jgi:hypothetical protein